MIWHYLNVREFTHVSNSMMDMKKSFADKIVESYKQDCSISFEYKINI